MDSFHIYKSIRTTLEGVPPVNFFSYNFQDFHFWQFLWICNFNIVQCPYNSNAKAASPPEFFFQTLWFFYGHTSEWHTELMFRVWRQLHFSNFVIFSMLYHWVLVVASKLYFSPIAVSLNVPLSYLSIAYLTHWGRDKMDAISQTTLSSAFSWMKMLEFQLRYHWSLFLKAKLTIF